MRTYIAFVLILHLFETSILREIPFSRIERSAECALLCESRIDYSLCGTDPSASYSSTEEKSHFFPR